MIQKKIKLKGDNHIVEIDGKLYVLEKKRTLRGTHSEEITLKLIKKEEYEKDIKETAEKLSKSLNAEELLEDVLRTTPYEGVRKIKRLLEKNVKVESKEGCFYLQIGKEQLFIRD